MEDRELQLLVKKFFVDDSCFSIPLEEFLKHTKDFRIVKLDAMVILAILTEVTNIDWKYDLNLGYDRVLFYRNESERQYLFDLMLATSPKDEYGKSLADYYNMPFTREAGFNLEKFGRPGKGRKVIVRRPDVQNDEVVASKNEQDISSILFKNRIRDSVLIDLILGSIPKNK